MLGKYRYANIRNGLLGHWRPSRGYSGNTLLDSVRGNNGALVNGPTWQASGSGLALSFDGTDDYIVTAAVIGALSQYSLSVWAIESTIRLQAIVNFGVGSLASVSTTDLRWQTNNSSATELKATATRTAGQWYHYAVASSGTASGQSALYINGVQAASTGALAALTQTVVNIGRRGESFNDRYLIGFVDDFSLFNRVLTASEILTLYTAGRGALDQRVNVPVVRGASIGQTISLGRATETEAATAVSVSNPNVLTLGRATETESVSALAVSNPNVVSLGRATETESANSLTISNPNVIALGRATETETANALTVQAGNTVQLGRAVETESVRTLTISNPNTVALSRAIETESARGLSVAIAQSIAIGRATETEVARGVTITTGSGSQSSYFYQFLAG